VYSSPLSVTVVTEVGADVESLVGKTGAGVEPTFMRSTRTSGSGVDGIIDGDLEGYSLGNLVGSRVVGYRVGTTVGIGVGNGDGIAVGEGDGTSDGAGEGQ
jgi:hypothetical protein